MGQIPQFALLNKAPGVLYQWSPTVVKTSSRCNVSSSGGSGNLDGVLCTSAHWLLAKDVFPGSYCSSYDLQMLVIGCRDNDDLHLRMLYYFLPVGGALAKAQCVLGTGSPFVYLIGANDETRSYTASRKAQRHLQIRTAVDLSHPPHANYSDPDTFCHAYYLRTLYLFA